MPAEFVPKPLPYLDRLVKAQRILKSALYRHDPRIQVREVCEALGEIVTALLEREQGPSSGLEVGQPPPPPLA